MPITPKQLGRLETISRSVYHSLKKGMGACYRPLLITQLMAEGILVAEQARTDKYGPVEKPSPVIAANSNGSVTSLANVYTAGALGVAAARALRRPEQKPPPPAQNDNSYLLSTDEAAVVIGITPQTLRRWVVEGRSIVGRRRKLKGELKVRQIGGHLKFEPASVTNLANKLKAYI